MPVTPANATPILTASLSSVGVVGVQAPQLAAALVTGLASVLPLIRVQTVATGVSGVGAGTGRITLDPITGTATLAAALSANGLNGFLTPALAQGIISGFATVLNTQAVVTTAVAAVSNGTGVGGVLGATPALLTPAFTTGLAAVGFVGSQTPSLAAALGQGISAWLSTGVVNTVIVGTPTVPPVSIVGTGTGSIL